MQNFLFICAITSLTCYVFIAAKKSYFANDKYHYRNYNFFIHIIDELLRPFMDIVATGKDAHWWDYSFVKHTLINKTVNQLQVSTGHPQVRKFRRVPIFGQYNPSCARDLYYTLRVLQKVAVLKPIDYDGMWSLVIRGNHRYETKDHSDYILCNMMTKGALKNLLDGSHYYIGLTPEGKTLELELLEICDRRKYPELLFV